MKYIDEKRLRVGYIGLFALAAGLTAFAWWDMGLGSAQYAGWTIAALGGILILAILFFVASELIVKDAIEVEKSDRFKAVETAFPVPEQGPWGSEPAAAHAAAAAQNAPKPEVVQLPSIVVYAANAPRPMSEDPGLLPKIVPPTGNRPAELKDLAYEMGQSKTLSAILHTRQGGKPHKMAGVQNARILCSNCGLYFQAHLDEDRPQELGCARCEQRLIVTGQTETRPHFAQRCRSCGDFLWVPRGTELTAVACASCGQTNELVGRSTLEAKASVAAAGSGAGAGPK